MAIFVIRYGTILSSASLLLGAISHPYVFGQDNSKAKVPPFHGTIFVEPSIIVDEDPTAFIKVTPAGSGERQIFDRRVDKWLRVNTWLFQADFEKSVIVEVRVNPEFSEQEAQDAVNACLPVIGQLPMVLRKDLRTISISKGKEPFGGGNHDLLIHTGMLADYVRQGILAETLCHEASHTSLDAEHTSNEEWQEAQRLDTAFISTYARDNPRREDVAESFLMWFALRYRRDRLSDTVITTIERTIPHRIKYFDSLKIDLSPVTRPARRN